MTKCVRNLDHVHTSAVQPRANMQLVLDHTDRDVLWLEPVRELRGADELFRNYSSSIQIPENISTVLHGGTGVSTELRRKAPGRKL